MIVLKGPLQVPNARLDDSSGESGSSVVPKIVDVKHSSHLTFIFIQQKS